MKDHFKVPPTKLMKVICNLSNVRILLLLLDEGTLNLSEIAWNLKTTRKTVSKSIDALESVELVNTDRQPPQRQQELLCTLSNKGKVMASKLQELFVEK